METRAEMKEKATFRNIPLEVELSTIEIRQRAK